MRAIEKSASALAAVGQSLSNFVCVFTSEGRRILMQRAEATTELKKLEVLELEREIAIRQANATIDLIERLEAIKDPILREKLEATFLPIGSKKLDCAQSTHGTGII